WGHNPGRSGTRRTKAPARLALVPALVAAMVAGGCGAAGHSAGPPSLNASVAADPPKVTGGAGAPGGGAGANGPTASDPRAPTAPGKIAPAHPVPAAFRPAAGAASDAEVRSQLAQLDALKRKEHEQALSAAAANLAGLLPWAQEPRSGIQVSVASVFTDYGLGLACGGVLGRNQLGVAHKTAPCGTLITFVYGGRALTVPVIDRGPYIAGREWDLTGATAAALGFPGLGRIKWALAR
ncbi:MAG: rare lipoprotein, partial [Solirubrobacteraceae bacterium]|nr:rare lipoprotein [Solirubrobacteraceae bacterium]